MNAALSAPAFTMTLSVNPVAKTLGALHPELQATLLRSGRSIARDTRRAASLRPLRRFALRMMSFIL